MGFLSSLRGLVKHEPVVTTSPATLKKSETAPIHPMASTSTSSHVDQHSRSTSTSPTKISTQRPAPSTPSPRAHA